MKPVRILRLLFVLPAVILLPVVIKAQCINTVKSLSFDTLVNGSGNDSYSFNTPQFNPSLGTLIAVTVKTTVSIAYGFQVENNTSSSRSVTIGVGRYDYLGSSALTNSYYANGVQKNYGPYTLGAANATPNSGPDYLAKAPFTFLKNTAVINDSITASVTGFMGYGTVPFVYYPSTYSVIPSNLTYTFTAVDTTKFSVTYYYCNTGVLASDITAFTAAKETNTTVKLAWETLNEETGRTYEIEESADGNNFIYTASISSAPGQDAIGNYIYQYQMKGNDKGNLYFRLREIDKTSNVKYSEIRMVDMGEGDSKGLGIFPNPARSFINVVFNQSSLQNWQVDIFAANGALIQRNYYFNTGTAHIEFNEKLAAGAYFVRVTDRQTLKSFVSTFVIM